MNDYTFSDGNEGNMMDGGDDDERFDNKYDKYIGKYTGNDGKQAEKLPLTHWRIEKPDSDDEEVSDGSDTDSWHRHQISALISFFSYLQQTHFLFTSYNMK